jgi:hypothetical protein
VLASGLHGEEALRRFEQEACATCALNHANILDLHDIAMHDASLEEAIMNRFHTFWRAGFLVAAVTLGCATAVEAGAGASGIASDKACAFDTDCPGGSCEFSKCSPFPRTVSDKACAFDTDCPGGSCEFSRCSPFPRTSPP